MNKDKKKLIEKLKFEYEKAIIRAKDNNEMGFKQAEQYEIGYATAMIIAIRKIRRLRV